jgi:mevalonate kinase
MKASCASIVTIALVVMGASVWAQQPTPTPAIPPEPPSPPGWDGFYYKFSQSQNQAAQLAQKYVKSEKADEKQEIMKKLKDAVSQQFDQHLQQQQKELKDLEQEIANLRAALKKREDAKSAIVDRRIDTLVHDAEGLGWSGPSHSRPGSFWVDPFGAPGTPAPAPRAK